MEANAMDKPVQREITALLSDERLILRETERAVTPFGGVAVFLSFLGKIGFVKAVREHMPIRWRSPNHLGPTATFTAFLIAVLGGARRFAGLFLMIFCSVFHCDISWSTPSGAVYQKMSDQVVANTSYAPLVANTRPRLC
jgi:hypothetical protein